MTDDPEHAAYLASMSDTEAAAYETALWGPITEEGPDGSVTREGGCRDRWSEPPGRDEAERAHLRGVAEEMYAFFDKTQLEHTNKMFGKYPSCLKAHAVACVGICYAHCSSGSPSPPPPSLWNHVAASRF